MISSAFKDSPMPKTVDTILLCLLALFIPPLPIYLMTFPKSKVSTREFWISVLFTILLFGGGVLYSFYFILVMFPDARRQNSYFYPQGDLENNQETLSCCTNEQCQTESTDRSIQVSPETTTGYVSSPLCGEVETEPLLPSYSDIAESGKDSQAAKDAKGGDNKVQK